MYESQDMSEWEAIFSKAFDFVKKDITQYHSHDDLEEMTPNERALVLGINKLPLPVEIMDVEVNSQENPHLKDNICQLIRYNLPKIGENQVKYCGKVHATKDAIYDAMIEHFGISSKRALSITEILIKKFEYTGFSIDDGSYIQFTRYDIRNNMEEFLQDLRSLFYHSFNDYIINRFKTEKETDFNILYQLKNDPILSSNEFLKPDSRSEHVTLEYLQSIISDIQLIPEVPEPVRIEFQRAKDLFIFSYFRYEFFTLSSRSALFALEVAMKERYLQSLKGKAVITYEDQIVHEMTKPTYSQISDFLYEMRRTKKWKFKNVKVNDNEFPFGMRGLINWLGRNGSPKWKLQLYEVGRKLRNSLAHPEHASIYPPSNGMLLRIAYDINELFSSKKE